MMKLTLLLLLLATPTHTLTIKRGTVMVSQFVPEGESMPVSAGSCASGETFSHWVVQPPAGGRFADATKPATTFTMGTVDATIAPTCWQASR